VTATKSISIGEVAKRTGLSVSAIRFYADEGLVHPIRNAAGHRHFQRADIRRISFILIAQQLGFSLTEIATTLQRLPDGRTPSKRDWDKLAREFQQSIDDRITRLTSLRSKLNQCIGCGCLSLQQCRLYNPGDRAAGFGSGPRYLVGDEPIATGDVDKRNS